MSVYALDVSRKPQTNPPSRDELLLLALALDTHGHDRHQFLALMAGQPDEAVKQAFRDTVTTLEFAE